MNKLTLTIAATALVGLYAGTASAACSYNTPFKAKGVKADFVRAYAPCPSTENPTSNTQTEGGTEACTPVTPREVDGVGTLYSFGPKGACKGSTSAKLVSDCSTVKGSDGIELGLQPGPCHITFVKAQCKGILGTDGITLIGELDTGWSFSTLSRATLTDDTNGDMTVIDFPVTFLFGTPKNGSIKLKSNSAEALAPLVGVNNADLPDCTQLEVVDIVIKAPGTPDALPFARMGGATVAE